MRNVREYAVITATYWMFTLTDGALRMLVLLHLHELGYSPLEIVSLFLIYELFGVITNGAGGWIGARYGLRSTLFAGLSIQIAALTALGARATALSLPLLLLSQGMSGAAKDLTKMSAKSYVKLVVPDGDQRGLLRWVALLTGSKNALKGAGFFLGGALLTLLDFRWATWAMALALVVALAFAAVLLSPAAGRVAKKPRMASLIARDPRVNWLSASRLFLFGARDIWFAVALPIFLSSGLGWSHARVGGFLAVWIIGYGFVQAVAPSYLDRVHGSDGAPANARHLALWTLALVLPLGGILIALATGSSPAAVLVSGLIVFAVVFATDSAIHSYLIVSYADADTVALDVGFYYMANAAGRLAGTVLSGALFQAAGQGLDGLRLCLAGALVLAAASAVACIPLRASELRSEGPRTPLAVSP